MAKTSRSKPVKTIRLTLCAEEKIRKYLWCLFIDYTLLVNQLLEELPQHNSFESWRKAGSIPKKQIQSLCNELKKIAPFDELPARFYTSAVSMVHYTFASLFATQNKLRAKCEGKQRWLSVAQEDIELAQTTNFSSEAVREAAAQILEEAKVEHQQDEQTEQSRSVMTVLFKFWDETKDLLRRRAIAHLLRNDCQVNPEEEDPDKLALRLSKKQIQIERLQEQMNSQLPVGRDPLGTRTQRFIEEAIALPDLSDALSIEEEFAAWEDSLSERIANLSTNLSSLPYPLLFSSNDDVRWSWEPLPKSESEQSQPACSDPQTAPVQQKRCRTRKRKKQARRRICVSFKSKGLSQLRLRLYCDRRHLPIFRQLVEDSKVNQERKKPDKFSLSLFPLRTAVLHWVKDPQKSQGQEQLPWQTHRLHLHATIDPRLLTAEGTEEVRQEKIALMEKFLEGLEKPTEEQIEESTEEEQAELLTTQKNRCKVTKKNQTTLTYLQNNSPPSRPSRVAYQGNPNINVKVAFSREQVLGVAVADATQTVLDYCNVKSLLIDPRVKLMEQRSLKLRQQPERLRKAKLATATSKHPRNKAKISARQLQLQHYRLLKRWRRLKRKNKIERQAEQQRGLYRPSQAEANLAQYLNRILARNIVDLAQRWSAGVILLPDFGELRENVESEIKAKAKEKYCDDNVERQKEYAKEFRMQFHQWNYKDLSQCIRSRAAAVGISCVTGQQPRLGTLREKAIAIAPIPPPSKTGS